ncbi:MAG: lytic transglycosylase domain-containing protein [Pseudobdellovibrionaceae bacterium]|jgi:soluble lytic murein transglycosylase-like protein|nr:lytic transglycosylase domain-containing protein [Pseudobdellovibrionaceae bacterium]
MERKTASAPTGTRYSESEKAAMSMIKDIASTPTSAVHKKIRFLHLHEMLKAERKALSADPNASQAQKNENIRISLIVARQIKSLQNELQEKAIKAAQTDPLQDSTRQQYQQAVSDESADVKTANKASYANRLSEALGRHFALLQTSTANILRASAKEAQSKLKNIKTDTIDRLVDKFDRTQTRIDNLAFDAKTKYRETKSNIGDALEGYRRKAKILTAALTSTAALVPTAAAIILAPVILVSSGQKDPKQDPSYSGEFNAASKPLPITQKSAPTHVIAQTAAHQAVPAQPSLKTQPKQVATPRQEAPIALTQNASQTPKAPREIRQAGNRRVKINYTALLRNPEYRDLLVQAAHKMIHEYSTEEVFQGIILTESNGNQLDRNGNPVRSTADAIGIAQVLPSTAADIAHECTGKPLNLKAFYYNQDYNYNLGYCYFKSMRETYGNNILAGLAYNGGPAGLEWRMRRNGYTPTNDPHKTVEFMGNIKNPENREYIAQTMVKLGLIDLEKLGPDVVTEIETKRYKQRSHKQVARAPREHREQPDVAYADNNDRPSRAESSLSGQFRASHRASSRATSSGESRQSSNTSPSPRM